MPMEGLLGAPRMQRWAIRTSSVMVAAAWPITVHFGRVADPAALKREAQGTALEQRIGHALYGRGAAVNMSTALRPTMIS